MPGEALQLVPRGGEVLTPASEFHLVGGTNWPIQKGADYQEGNCLGRGKGENGVPFLKLPALAIIQVTIL
jgi:hypothetical protein